MPERYSAEEMTVMLTNVGVSLEDAEKLAAIFDTMSFKQLHKIYMTMKLFKKSKKS